MRNRRTLKCAVVVLLLSLMQSAGAQFGGGMGGGPGGAGAPPGIEKPKFRDHLFQQGGMRVQRERGDKLVAKVTIQGNRTVGLDRVMSQIQTREGRVYDFNLVMEDVRRLHRFGAFGRIRPVMTEQADGMHVTYIVEERPVVQTVQFHGNHGINDRELRGRVGIEKGDPLNQFSIESARSRLQEYYHEEGFNQATIETVQGAVLDGKNYPNAVVFRINEGPLERVKKIDVVGNTFVSAARLKKIIKTRGAFLNTFNLMNRAKMEVINSDVDNLTSYYRNLGFFDAEVGLMKYYDESGKYLNLRFVIVEGPRYKVRNIRLVGNKYVQSNSLMQSMMLKEGEYFDRAKMQSDMQKIRYGLGSLGFIFADVEVRPTVLDEPGVMDVVYKVAEGDQYRCGEIRIHVEGDDHLVSDHVIKNRLEFHEGELLDRRNIDRSERLLKAAQVFVSNPAEGALPRIAVQQPTLIDLDRASSGNY